MGHTVPDTATDASAPELRAAGPGDLDAVVDLLTGVFLDDPLMSAIAAAAPLGQLRALLSVSPWQDLQLGWIVPTALAFTVGLAADLAVARREA